MNTPRISASLAIVVACGTLGLRSLPAHADAAYPAEITISAPQTKVIGRSADGAQIEQRSATAHVPYDPVTLTTNSGVALLKERVRQAAREVCGELDPLGEGDDNSCVSQAVSEAKPQIEAAVARANEVAPKEL
jgi:UrcA family protein